MIYKVIWSMEKRVLKYVDIYMKLSLMQGNNMLQLGKKPYLNALIWSEPAIYCIVIMERAINLLS